MKIDRKVLEFVVCSQCGCRDCVFIDIEHTSCIRQDCSIPQIISMVSTYPSYNKNKSTVRENSKEVFDSQFVTNAVTLK